MVVNYKVSTLLLYVNITLILQTNHTGAELTTLSQFPIVHDGHPSIASINATSTSPLFSVPDDDESAHHGSTASSITSTPVVQGEVCMLLTCTI